MHASAEHENELIGLVSKLFELEALIHREAFRRAERAELRGGRALDLRTLVVQASQSLDDLIALAERRGVSLVSLGTVWRDAIRCVRGGILDHLLAPRPAEADLAVLLGALRRGIGIARRLEEVATEEDDSVLAAFCRRWLAAREPVVAALSESVDESVDVRPMPRPAVRGRRGRRRPRRAPAPSVQVEAPSSARW